MQTSFLSKQLLRISPVAMAMLAIAILCAMDGVLKDLTARYSSLQVTFMRFAPSAMFGAMFFFAWRTPRSRRSILGNISAAPFLIASALFIHAIARAPLTQVFAISYIAPLLAALLAMPVLGERPDGRVGLSLALGFVGVLIAMGGVDLSGASLSHVEGALSAFASSLCYAFVLVYLRRQAMSDPPITIALFQNSFPRSFSDFICGGRGDTLRGSARTMEADRSPGRSRPRLCRTVQRRRPHGHGPRFRARRGEPPRAGRIFKLRLGGARWPHLVRRNTGRGDGARSGADYRRLRHDQALGCAIDRPFRSPRRERGRRIKSRIPVGAKEPQRRVSVIRLERFHLPAEMRGERCKTDPGWNARMRRERKRQRRENDAETISRRNRTPRRVAKESCRRANAGERVVLDVLQRIDRVVAEGPGDRRRVKQERRRIEAAEQPPSPSILPMQRKARARPVETT